MEFQEYQRRADTTLLNSLRENLIEKLEKLGLWTVRELGEAADEHLKTSTEGHRDQNEKGMNIEHFVEELGDCFWCVSELCDHYDIPLEKAAQGNLVKISKRYNKETDINNEVTTFEEYEIQAKKTIIKYRTFKNQTQREAKISVGLFGIASKLGMIIPEIGKQVIGFYVDEEDVPQTDMLKEKAGDTLWYMMLCCEAVGYSLEQMVEMNLAKLQERYGSQTVKVKEETITQNQGMGIDD